MALYCAEGYRGFKAKRFLRPVRQQGEGGAQRQAERGVKEPVVCREGGAADLLEKADGVEVADGAQQEQDGEEPARVAEVGDGSRAEMQGVGDIGEAKEKKAHEQGQGAPGLDEALPLFGGQGTLQPEGAPEGPVEVEQAHEGKEGCGEEGDDIHQSTTCMRITLSPPIRGVFV